MTNYNKLLSYVIVGIIVVFSFGCGKSAVRDGSADYNVGTMVCKDKEHPVLLPKEIDPKWLKRYDFQHMQFSENVWMFYWPLPEIRSTIFTLIMTIKCECPKGCYLGLYGVIGGKFMYWIYDEDKPVSVNEKAFQERIYGHDNVPLRRKEK